MKKEHKYIIVLLLGVIVSLSCKKDFLDKKPISARTVPVTLDDFQRILDAEVYLRDCPGYGEISSDDYQLSDAVYKSISDARERNLYIWNKDIYITAGEVFDWNSIYRQVFYANVVLEGLNKMQVNSADQSRLNFLKGSALFIRAYAFYNLAQVFSPVYGEDAGSNPYGIPLRLKSDINDLTTRPTVLETYDQILKDLLDAKEILPATFQTTNRNRPSKVAAEALLARVYLSMRNYLKAGEYADNALKFYSKLIDYNSISLTATIPFSVLNDEVLYQSSLNSSSAILTNLAFTSGYSVNQSLYESYDINDLRKSIFYSASGLAKYNYSGSYSRFNGMATDELYLIRAECNARAGKIIEAMKDLNDLLKNRWKKNQDGSSTYIDQTATNSNDALLKILIERRKELVFRGLRWTDLRRLNYEGNNITLTRVAEGNTYTLAPNDLRYVLPIPTEVINLTGIAQNPR